MVKVFNCIVTPEFKKIKVLNITIYYKKMGVDINKVKYLYGLIKIVKHKYYKKVYFLGIRIYKKKNEFALLRDDVVNMIQRDNKFAVLRNDISHIVADIVQKNVTTAILHQNVFLPFKNCHRQDSIVMIGAGPTVSKFIPLNNVVYCGLNRSFKISEIEFNYLFSTNKTGIEDYKDEFINYKGNNCVKFIGDENGDERWQIPESLLLKSNAYRYMNTSKYPKNTLTFFIDSQPIYASSTVSIQAMQFLLYTNPKRIFVVGIDCSVSTQGHFIGKTSDIALKHENLANNDLRAVEDFKKLKEFAQIYYPDTEIISVNPVGLKGIFRDIYTNTNGEYVDELGKFINLNEELVYEKNN